MGRGLVGKVSAWDVGRARCLCSYLVTPSGTVDVVKGSCGITAKPSAPANGRCIENHRDPSISLCFTRDDGGAPRGKLLQVIA